MVEENKTQVQIQGQYVKSMTFQSPAVPSIFTKMKEAPKAELALDIRVKQDETDTYEVTLLIKAKALYDIKTVFTVDLEYAGLFKIVNCDIEDQKKQILMVYCPTLLFPFVRRIVADVSRDGSFPPLMLNPVDFGALYLQQQKNEHPLQ